MFIQCYFVRKTMCKCYKPFTMLLDQISMMALGMFFSKDTWVIVNFQPH